jgi:hypothetical protein
MMVQVQLQIQHYDTTSISTTGGHGFTTWSSSRAERQMREYAKIQPEYPPPHRHPQLQRLSFRFRVWA